GAQDGRRAQQGRGIPDCRGRRGRRCLCRGLREVLEEDWGVDEIVGSGAPAGCRQLSPHLRHAGRKPARTSCEAAQVPASESWRKAVKIGMCMFLWTTKVTKKHEPLLKDIKAAGFDGVEIPIFEGTKDDYSRLGERLDRIGLGRTAVSAMGDPGMNLISPDA